MRLKRAGFEDNIRASYDVGDPHPTKIHTIRDQAAVHYFEPATPRVPGSNPCVVMIHGGGWKGGTPSEHYRWCRYVKEFWQDFSPVHNLNNELPDSLVLMGDRDPLIRMAPVEKFGRAVMASGSDFEWIVFPGKGHGLFNQSQSYLTPELLHIYYAFHVFLGNHGYMEAPLPASDDVRVLVRRQSLQSGSTIIKQ